MLLQVEPRVLKDWIKIGGLLPPTRSNVVRLLWYISGIKYKVLHGRFCSRNSKTLTRALELELEF